MNTETNRAVVLTVLSILIFVAGWKGVRAKHMTLALNISKGRPVVLTAQLSDISARITSIFYIIAGLFMFTPVVLARWYEGETLEILMYLLAGASILTIICGLFLGTVTQAAINVGEQLRKTSTSDNNRNKTDEDP